MSEAGPARPTEGWAADAIAAQEEHIRRNTSCSGQLGRAHRWATYGAKTTPGVTWQACTVCGVTRTEQDYETRGRHGDVPGTRKEQ